MEHHEYRSKPVTVTAVQIDDSVQTTTERIDEAFGTEARDHLRMAADPISDSAGADRRVLDVTMTTIQGQQATAKPGEWIAQEHADPTRFYPIADEAMRRRYTVPKRARR